MKKQLLLATACAFALSTQINAGMMPLNKPKHKMGTKGGLYYVDTIKNIKAGAHQLNKGERMALVNSLLGYFHGKPSLTRLSPAASDIYAEATRMYDTLKAQDGKRLGSSYAKSTHFAQKVIGIILFPGPKTAGTPTTSAQKLTTPAQRLRNPKYGPGPVITNPRTHPVGPERGGIQKLRPAKGPQSGGTRAGF